MDLNIKIIEGIRQIPYLHENNDNWEERNQAWMQLAEKLGVPEQILKVRWHSLLRGYHRDANFKYANKMNFVHRNAGRTTTEIWPEFVINEDDIKYDNSEEIEPFVLLEASENPISKNCKENSTEENTCNKDISKYVVKVPSKFFKNDHEKSDQTNLIKNGKTSKLYAVQKKNEMEAANHKSKEKDAAGINILSMEKQMAEAEVNKGVCSREAVVEKSHTLVPERCEDVIFGELVSAMLKRMDENKKKHIKREIMNLLFS